MNIRPEVMRFAKQMEIKLRRNDTKGGWEECPLWWLRKRLLQEANEVKRAIKRGHNVWGECADVGNFAMMIAENFRKKP